MDWKIYVVQEYHKGRGTSDIGRELDKNPKIIRDVLVKNGIPLRSHSQAQKLVIEKNGPPIQRPRTEEEKKKISQGLDKFWTSLDEDEESKIKADLAKRAKEAWAALDKDEKEINLQKMRVAARANAGNGSKAENTIASLLAEKYDVERRSKSVIYPYEVDIFLPKQLVAIEIDGPTHFSNIYGEDNLRNVQRRDKTKNAYIVGKGVHLIRCRDKTTSFSVASCTRAVSSIKELIEKLPTISYKKAKVHIIEIK